MVYIIAEIGVNHNRDLNIAERAIAEAKKAGADAVKFQLFTANDLVSKKADPQQHALLSGLEVPRVFMSACAQFARKDGIDFLCTPFAEDALDFLLDLGMARVKIASPDLVNTLLVNRAYAAGIPLILSTGGASMAEVRHVIKGMRRERVTLLHCVSLYPTPVERTNLRAMVSMRDTTGFPVGMSDHSVGEEVPLAATALGAKIIEKHFTLDCSLPGPDHAMSMMPAEFASMVHGIRMVESALGTGEKKPELRESLMMRKVRRGAYAIKPIKAGETITPDMVAMKRPWTPRATWDVIGAKAEKDYDRDDAI